MLGSRLFGTLTGVAAFVSALPAPQSSGFSNAVEYHESWIPLISDKQNATVWAATFGDAITTYRDFALPIIKSIGTNAVKKQRQLSTASTAAIARPNSDTLYASMVIDLSQYDVVLTVPEIGDNRFYNFPILDLYSNNFANLGVVNYTKAGDYLFRRAADYNVTVGQEFTNGTQFNGKTYQGFVNFPTTYGYIVTRFLVRNNGSDVDQVNAYQDAIKLTPVNRTQPPGRIAPPLTADLLEGNMTGTSEEKTLQLIARMVQYNPPYDPQFAANTSYNLQNAGLIDGTYYPQTGVNVSSAYAMSYATIIPHLLDPATRQNFSGGSFYQYQYDISGIYGGDIAIRAFIDTCCFAQQRPYVALYPEPVQLTVRTNSSSSTLFTFSGKPPVEERGFWSLTLYGEDNYLVDNPLNVYALGDRSNLTYPDGTKIYGEGSDQNKDGPFQILIQDADIAPPTNWTGNWLPAAAGGGNYGFNFRLYVAKEEIYSSYMFPTIEAVAPLKG